MIREITHGLDRITNLLDDILVIGYGDADHDGKLDALLNTFSKRDATLNYERFECAVADMQFAGLTIDLHYVHPLESNLDALLQILAASKVNELDSFLSTPNY